METVGEILLSEREKRGLTVKDVEAATSIRALYISAIENNNFTVIPGEVYLKGFIRNYANYLGLNGQEMVDLYRKQQLPPSETFAEPPMPETDASPAAANSGSFGTKWVILGAAAVILAAGAWWLTTGKESNPVQPKAGIPAPAQQQAPIQSQAQAPIPSPLPAQQPAKTKPVAVTAKFTAECWAQITVDGKEVFEGMVEAGALKTWDAEQTITVKLGNAGAAELVHNGQPVGKLGSLGEVVVKKFTR